MKKIFTIALIIIAIVLIVFGIRWFMQPKKIVYSNNPADWLSASGKGFVVDVKQATRGRGEYNDVNQQFLLPGGDITAFAYEGIYRGNFFSTQYTDDSGKVVMEVTPDLNPNDGILQGFMVERSNNGVLETHIFIDEDLRRALGNNIFVVWGADYSNSKPFAFEQVKPGIYHDVVLDDGSRIQPDASVGGIQVGNMKPGGVDPANAGNIILVAIH